MSEAFTRAGCKENSAQKLIPLQLSNEQAF